jgi:hypothetical protein
MFALKSALRDVVKWTAMLGLFAGCRAKQASPSVADLHFPVAVIFGTSSVVAFKDAADLSTMRMGNLNTLTGPPPLIDSSFAIYTMIKLGSTHNGLWLMTHPTSGTPVTFELERAPNTGIEAARALLRARLDDQTWRRDLEEKRRALAVEPTLAGMIEIVAIKDE